MCLPAYSGKREPIPYLEGSFLVMRLFPDTKVLLGKRLLYEALTGIFAAFAEIQVPVTGEGSTLYTVSN